MGESPDVFTKWSQERYARSSNLTPRAHHSKSPRSASFKPGFRINGVPANTNAVLLYCRGQISFVDRLQEMLLSSQHPDSFGVARLVIVRYDHNRNSDLLRRQAFKLLKSAQPPHVKIHNQAVALKSQTFRQKIFSDGESHNVELIGPEKAPKRFAELLFIVQQGNKWA